MPILKITIPLCFFVAATACSPVARSKYQTELKETGSFVSHKRLEQRFTLSRKKYREQLQGFWLGKCIANWTGLVTEMDKIGDTQEFKTGAFYTRNDWGKPDQPSIWAEGKPSNLSATIDFVFRDKDQVWGADDDTDIEYMYQHLMHTQNTSILSAEQIRDGWLKHIKTEEENYLWVSNQQAFDLMNDGVLPPETSRPDLNPHYEMIDAQLTTEIFGLFAPGRPDFALKMAKLPIAVTARKNAQWISEFYVVMYSMAGVIDQDLTISEQTKWLAKQARKRLPEDSYSAKMYDFVLQQYQSGTPWESTRDAVYQRYQLEQHDGYDVPSLNLYCDGCFAAGINFAASIISLLYGEGDIKQTIKIGTLAGWDSDNPTATWGGLLGFILGKQGVEQEFDRSFSNTFNIHRTRVNFPNDGLESFESMSDKGLEIIDRVVEDELNGFVDIENNSWVIPLQN